MKHNLNDRGEYNHAKAMFRYLKGREARGVNTFPNGETNREAFISWFGITPEEFKQLPKPKAKGPRGK